MLDLREILGAGGGVEAAAYILVLCSAFSANEEIMGVWRMKRRCVAVEFAFANEAG